MKFKSVDHVLDYSIAREEEAHAFYMDLADKMSTSIMSDVFRSFALEELGHKAKLEGIKAGKQLQSSAAEVKTLNIADYVVDIEVTPNLDYQDALIIAMKKEKAAFRLYSDLSAIVQDAGLKEIFAVLAQEEAKHKLRFEVEYDEHILTDN